MVLKSMSKERGRSPPSPGQATADDRVAHGEGDVAPVEEAVHPLVRENSKKKQMWRARPDMLLKVWAQLDASG
ncbi:hypothetical protein EYF80_024872 [Liparis tanakae]|uniref:Uncharacterized protein n=1 Tax=Liparis tanakae TaxID=230148 RepID=A0A4Z2HIW3_9TELE|nr:hypothetical protein EYF80_024872 [Liparis tanakae]